MIRLFNVAYSNYNKVTYLYSVTHSYEDYDKTVNDINKLLLGYRSYWDWEREVGRVPVVVGSNGELYFLSDDDTITLLGRDKNGGLSYYVDFNTANSIYGEENSLEILLKDVCEKTYRLYKKIYQLMGGSVYMYGVRCTVVGDKEIKKIYLNTHNDFKLKLINTIEELTGFYFFDLKVDNVFSEKELCGISVCGNKQDKVKFYFKPLDNPVFSDYNYM